MPLSIHHADIEGSVMGCDRVASLTMDIVPHEEQIIANPKLLVNSVEQFLLVITP